MVSWYDLRRLDTHPRTLRRNIWKGLLCASDQEIRDGMDFYPGAHGLCRLFASIYRTTPSHVAGIYAALSPMNTWDTNVANVLDVLRYNQDALSFSLKVNTTHINRDKALAIAAGSPPLDILQGRKVRAFYSCIANPDDFSIPPAIDRHLINLALGTIPTKDEQSRLASNRDIYSRVEAAFLDLGRREGIGNRLASIAWFVQRRIDRTGQQVFPHPGSPVCCSIPMHCQGAKRFYCKICKKTRARAAKTATPLPADLAYDIHVPYSLGMVGRVPIVYLPEGHPHRNGWGWQYLARHVVMETTRRILRRDEHVHHGNGKKVDCRTDNLEVWLAERHGRHHANHQLLYMLRDELGRWARSQVPAYSEQVAERETMLEEVPF